MYNAVFKASNIVISNVWFCYLGLVQKAKKAKDKLLKRDGDERTESSYESFYYGGVDPYMWEPQELGELIYRCLI